MAIDDRLHALKQSMVKAQNDDTRYAVAETVRDLGYIDFRDFFEARPALSHVEVIERTLNLHP
ncbi:hypothetical protein J2W40_001571 [Sphingobium xenophagum]|uniref:HTH araC/xylS-type domain-containing protein n=1 Tax=Sphingobium xenophagum TaxID=121428 RepID=A0ABU1X0Q5_SPHXE|nr:hypothetical protein [Sphingobium xenophagum]MDR7154756.1 hypothetical protein [Sphingobium xenophagum]